MINTSQWWPDLSEQCSVACAVLNMRLGLAILALLGRLRRRAKVSLCRLAPGHERLAERHTSTRLCVCRLGRASFITTYLR